MKKISAFVAAVFVSVCAIAGGLNTYDGVAYTNLIENTRVPAATAITGSARNVSFLKGQGTVIIALTPGLTNVSNNGLSAQVQDSETGTTLWSNVSSVVATSYTTNGTITTFKLDTASVRKYLRVVATATNDSGYVSSVLVAYP